MGTTRGQMLLERIEKYIGKYVELPIHPEGQVTVLALWALHTWMYERFSATPRLAITANVKESGKTLCMEVLALVSRGSQVFATLRPLALLRWIRVNGGQVTAFIDEAEKLSSGAIGDLRSIFATGYNKGGAHMVTKGEEYTMFQTFMPVCCALIGDVMDVIRSRSITILLDRLKPKCDFRGMDHATAETEAAAIVKEIKSYFLTVDDLMLVQPGHLAGREMEIWAPLFSIAAALKVDGATMKRLIAVSRDLSEMKQQPARKFYDAKSEEKASAAVYAERAIRDLASVLPEVTTRASGDIFGSEAVSRMKQIPEGPWRSFKGVGLDADTLTGLVKVFGVTSKVVRMGRGREAEKGRGYSGADVRASVPGEKVAKG